MKLVDLIPLKEIDFKTQDAFDAYNKQHDLRPDTVVTIAGQKTTAGKASQKSDPIKGTSVFGKDNSGDDTNSDHSVMRKIKDFVGSKGFQFGARRPSEKEDSIADKHFSSYDNKSVSAIGVDKMTGNIYASNGDYEVVLSPDGKLLKKDSVQAGLDAYDDYLQKRADKYNKRQQQIKKLKSLIGLKEAKNKKK